MKLLYINDKKYKSGEVGSQAAKLTGNKKLGKELLDKEKKNETNKPGELKLKKPKKAL